MEEPASLTPDLLFGFLSDDVISFPSVVLLFWCYLPSGFHQSQADAGAMFFSLQSSHLQVLGYGD
jgi:hypothetical protein